MSNNERSTYTNLKKNRFPYGHGSRANPFEPLSNEELEIYAINKIIKSRPSNNR